MKTQVKWLLLLALGSTLNSELAHSQSRGSRSAVTARESRDSVTGERTSKRKRTTDSLYRGVGERMARSTPEVESLLKSSRDRLGIKPKGLRDVMLARTLTHNLEARNLMETLVKNRESLTSRIEQITEGEVRLQEVLVEAIGLSGKDPVHPFLSQTINEFGKLDAATAAQRLEIFETAKNRLRQGHRNAKLNEALDRALAREGYRVAGRECK